MSIFIHIISRMVHIHIYRVPCILTLDWLFIRLAFDFMAEEFQDIEIPFVQVCIFELVCLFSSQQVFFTCLSVTHFCIKSRRQNKF